MKTHSKLFLITLIFILGLIAGCDKDDNIANQLPVQDQQAKILKMAQVREYMESIVKDLARTPQVMSDRQLLDYKGPLMLNQLKSFENVNPYLVVSETAEKYKIVISRFRGSETKGPVLFSLDPDRFFANSKSLTAYKQVIEDQSLQKRELQEEKVEGLNPRSKVEFNLFFVDVEQIMSKERANAILDEMIKSSLIYKERGIKDVSMVCPEEGCGGGGGGAGPKPWLVLTYIQLKYDMDSGDDECELYMREANDFSLPGLSVQPTTIHIMSGDYRGDAASRYKWYPNLNNAGDSANGLDIALYPLSDTYPVSIVGIEDDDDAGKHDYYQSDGNPKTVLMNHEFRRDQNQIYSSVNRTFSRGDDVYFFDADDIWCDSHFANFTASNMTEGQEITVELGDFIVRLKKVTF